MLVKRLARGTTKTRFLARLAAVGVSLLMVTGAFAGTSQAAFAGGGCNHYLCIDVENFVLSFEAESGTPSGNFYLHVWSSGHAYDVYTGTFWKNGGDDITGVTQAPNNGTVVCAELLRVEGGSYGLPCVTAG